MNGRAGLAGTRLLNTSLIAGSVLLVVAVFLFTHQLITRLSNQVATTSQVFAQFCAEASVPATRNPEVQRIFYEVISRIDFPIVITDRAGNPRAWREVGIDPALVPAASIDSLAVGREISPVIHARIAEVRRRTAAIDRKHRPIVMMQSGQRDTLGYVHFGEPEVMDRLRWMPYLTVGTVGLLFVVGLVALAGIRTAEKRTIWVGMAKETAHQLGTPLSSMMGWIELLRGFGGGEDGGAGGNGGGDVRIPRGEFDETLAEMERDVERLKKVAQRFSHVGSAAVLQPQDVTPTVRHVVQYMRRRVPRSDQGVQVVERYHEVPPVNLNPELMEWAIENLIANALSALDKRPGLVEVEVGLRPQTETVEVTVRDNGRGMSREEQSRAFEPGFTTRSRGWGLGLALARRVVQDYHGGRLEIRSSVPGQGTTMVISFPT
jgi:signal transduction histidine kinase